MQGLNPFRRKNSGQNIYLFGSCRVLSFFTTTCFDQKHISSKKLVAKKHNTRQWPSKLFFCLEFFRWGLVCLDEFFRPDVGLRTSRDPLGTNLDEQKLDPNMSDDKIIEFFHPDWLPTGPRAPGGQMWSNPN